MASRRERSGRAKVPNRILVSIITFIPILVELFRNIELLTNPTLVIPGLLDIQLAIYTGRLDLEEGIKKLRKKLENQEEVQGPTSSTQLGSNGKEQQM